MEPSADRAQSVDSLAMDSSNSAEYLDPKTPSPNPMAVGNQEKVGFLSLPREVRDQIYLDLVVAENPIQYSENFDSLCSSDTFADTAMKWMFDVESNIQIARETREIFYQHNTFLIYTHDIPKLLNGGVHAMSFKAGRGLETAVTYRIPFKAGAWVRNLAVRVGWHTSEGWFTNTCCCYPAGDLQLLLYRASLRSVIMDARFGAWPYGRPQGIPWELLEEMKTKWGKEFRIYNDQSKGRDTRRYTSDRREISDAMLLRYRSSQNADEAETASGKSEQEVVSEHDEAEQLGFGETAAESEEGEREESEQEEREESDQEAEDYWDREEAARSETSEVRAREGSDEYEGEWWSGDELAQEAWSIGETLIMQAGERLIRSAWNGEHGDAEW